MDANQVELLPPSRQKKERPAGGASLDQIAKICRLFSVVRAWRL